MRAGIGGEVNESEVCEREARGESEKRDGMECDEVMSGEGEWGRRTRGGAYGRRRQSQWPVGWGLMGR
jgi:hypothetical protein